MLSHLSGHYGYSISIICDSMFKTLYTSILFIFILCVYCDLIGFMLNASWHKPAWAWQPFVPVKQFAIELVVYGVHTRPSPITCGKCQLYIECDPL